MPLKTARVEEVLEHPQAIAGGAGGRGYRLVITTFLTPVPVCRSTGRGRRAGRRRMHEPGQGHEQQGTRAYQIVDSAC